MTANEEMSQGYEIHSLNGTEGGGAWNAAVSEIPSSNFFHTNEWLNFVENQFQLKLRRILISRYGQLEGILPFFEKRYGFLKIAGSPLIAENNPYMGFAFKDGYDAGLVLSSLDRFFKKERIGFFRASFDHAAYWEHFERSGYFVKEKKSFRLDLSPDEQLLWKGIGQKGRNMVRKAEKHNLVFAEAASDAVVDAYYEMSRDVYARRGLPPLLRKSYYNDLYSEIVSKDMARVFLACSADGNPVAGAILLIYKDNAYYLDGVSLKAVAPNGTNNFLQWNIMKSLKEMGVRNYDLLGGDITGIASFKKSLGTTNFPTIYVEKPISRTSRLARRVYANAKALSKNVSYTITRLKGRAS